MSVLTTVECLIKVAIELPYYSVDLNDSYYYKVPEELSDTIKPGSVVLVPFGARETVGYVLEILSNESASSVKDLNDYEVKYIYDVIIPEEIWSKKFIELARWIGSYYFASIGTVLSSSISSDILGSISRELFLNSNLGRDLTDEKLTPDQRKLIGCLVESRKGTLDYIYLQRKLRFSKEKFYKIVNQLKKKGILNTKISYKKTNTLKKNPEDNYSLKILNDEQNDLPKEDIKLSDEQLQSYKTISSALSGDSDERFFLLHGVTGSGKTEVYFKLIEDVIKMDKKVIYLVPEIYLIPQIYRRLVKRFNSDSVIISHSSLSRSEKFANWESLNQENSKVKIILGARSALLTPINNVGLIVVDEAHESSYKQSSQTPRYDATKVAIKRAEIENCPVIFGTATPNIADYYFFKNEGCILNLVQRFQNVPMPEVKIINLKDEFANRNRSVISRSLKLAIETALANKEQVILLLNRRGYASYIFCRVCGFTQYCQNCSVPLVYHKNDKSLICHHCGYNIHFSGELSAPCPECSSIHFKHFGLGTQKLEEEVKKIFNTIKITRVDSDQLKRKDQYIDLWKSFADGKSDVLIGTQLVAKGLDLPNVTVVGVIIADSMLSFPDYISYERAYQLLTQVSGRAGRSTKPGKVYIQTYQPENEVFKYVKEHDYMSFYNSEIKQREDCKYPPFIKLLRIIFQSKDNDECLNAATEAKDLLSNLSAQQEYKDEYLPEFLGPAPCFFSKLNGKFRYHILFKIKDSSQSTQIIYNFYSKLRNTTRGVDVLVDVDSINLL